MIDMIFALIIVIVACMALSARVLNLESDLKDWQVEATKLKQSDSKQGSARLELVYSLSQKAISLDIAFCAIDCMIRIEDFLSSYVDQLEAFESANSDQKGDIILQMHDLTKEVAEYQAKLAIKSDEYAKQSQDKKASHCLAYARIKLSEALAEIQDGRDELVERLQ